MASEDRTQDYNDDLKRMSNKLGIPTPQSIETPITETSQLSQILSGWGNRIKDTFGVLDEETKLMSEKRLLHCNVCYMRTGNTCDPRKKMKDDATGEIVTGCGCNISAKSMSPHSSCPLNKWDK
jgi:hypothetical protein